MLADGLGPEIVTVTTAVDEVANMVAYGREHPGAGQYIYAWVLRSGRHPATSTEGVAGEDGEPLIKFNNGLFGGTPEVLISKPGEPAVDAMALPNFEEVLVTMVLKPAIVALGASEYSTT